MNQDNLFEEFVGAKSIRVDRSTLSSYLYDVLNDISLGDFILLLTNKFSEIVQYADLSVGKNTCQKTSLLFNPHRLDVVAGKSKESIFSALKTKSFCDGLARVCLLIKKDKVVVNDFLAQTIQYGINGVQYVNEFQPYVGRDICIEFNLNKQSNVLDPCAGWGGRMIGVSVVCNHYTCFEPSTKTFNGLNLLFDFIKKLQPDFEAHINNICFEDSCLNTEHFDFAITSPPYYDTERYTDEETNSLNRYKTFELWCDGFYCPMIKKTMDALKVGSTFVLNIGSRKYPLNEILKSEFGKKYEIGKLKNYLSGNSGGLNKSGEGETFYTIKK